MLELLEQEESFLDGAENAVFSRRCQESTVPRGIEIGLRRREKHEGHRQTNEVHCFRQNSESVNQRKREDFLARFLSLYTENSQP